MAVMDPIKCLIVLFFAQNTLGIVNIDPEKKERIDNFANSLLFDCESHQNVVGMNLAVVYEGEILYTTGYGLRNLDTNEPVTENSVYGIASVSKHFTTTLLGQTLRNTGYNWDTKVRDILGDLGDDFYFYDPLRTNITSLRDLGSHSTGIARNDYWWIVQNMPREEIVNRFRFIQGVEEPRTTFRYNNLMYTLQGYVTEKLAGRSWEELVQTEIYNKVGMVNSSMDYYITEEGVELATPYITFEGAPREVAWQSYIDMGADLGPAGGVSSTANDMARWMNVLLSGGLNEAGERVFDEDVVLEIQSPVNAYAESTLYYPPDYPISYNVWSAYGLGMGPGSYRGYRTSAHGGSLWGHYTNFMLFPDIGLGIYMSINGQEGLPSAMQNIALFAADVVLGEEPWLNSTTACEFPFPVSEPKHKDIDIAVTNKATGLKKKSSPLQRKVEEYLGVYGNFAYGNLTIVADDVTEELILNFDVYSCTYQNASGLSRCYGRGDIWFLILLNVEFDQENVPVQYVDITFTFERPIRFERDLLFEDAPGPTDHWPQCEEDLKKKQKSP